MILWINGTFGAGKTTIAYELHRRLENSFVYDPERFGYVLMDNVPRKIAKRDFQDYPLWRESNYKLLKHLSGGYDGVIIVPMTLTNVSYFDEIIGKLRKDGIDVKHFTLSALKQTIEQRLRKRLEGKKSWAFQQMDGRIQSLENPVFEKHIQTDMMKIEDVIEEIGQQASIELLPEKRTKFRKFLGRKIINIKEISLFKR